MRTRDEMLKDAGSARLRYAMLSNPSDMLMIRLAQDVTELLVALAEKDADLRALYGRIEEAEYGMVGGNLVHENISFECVSGWIDYIRDGEKNNE